ncbi:MAG: ATP-binding protein [Desulfovibrio sp.]|jgi:predicted AAA+ superfamily ATPase|nr:ATP-binding protein [Desulfovibrio sp.]
MIEYIERHTQNRLLNALAISPVVFLNGPRQSGKSTLVQHITREDFPAEYVTLDSATQMAAAAAAPELWLKERKGSLIIDEIQLVPEVFRALKTVVDELRRTHLQTQDENARRRFLLTGSANIMALPKLSDPLVGRMRVLTLYPLSGAEAVQSKGAYVDRLFARDFLPDKGGRALSGIVRMATFPEISGVSGCERSGWFEGYLTTILQRDVRSLAEIEKLGALPNLLRILGARAGGLVNDAGIARDAGLNHMTARNYKTLLQMLFLTFELAPWHRNIGKRLVKAPKGYVIDTLLLCHLLQYDLDDLEKNRPELFGHVVENFVAAELVKLTANSDHRPVLRHFRTGDNKEVDFVLEKPNGQLAGVEVKIGDRVKASDFNGLECLQALAKDDFVCGAVLYRGRDVVPFGKNLWAVPIANLWL